ncbi:MAG: AI-2E family transporter, partial [Gammaproteobacteria bacterium]
MNRNALRAWYERYLADPQVMSLLLVLGTGLAIVLLWGRILAPLIAAVVIAFLLDAAVERLACCPGMPRLVAVGLVFTLFMLLVISVLLFLVPLVLQQAGQVVREVPAMLAQGQEALMHLSERYPALFSERQALDLIDVLRGEAARFGQRILSLSLASLISVITLLVYLVLVPLLVFFFLKDKALILGWLRRFMPREDSLVRQVWGEVNVGLGSYVRGKFIEIVIVWFVTWIAFLLLGMNYAMLLSVLVGLSVIIPYV